MENTTCIEIDSLVELLMVHCVSQVVHRVSRFIVSCLWEDPIQLGPTQLGNQMFDQRIDVAEMSW